MLPSASLSTLKTACCLLKVGYMDIFAPTSSKNLFTFYFQILIVTTLLLTWRTPPVAAIGQESAGAADHAVSSGNVSSQQSQSSAVATAEQDRPSRTSDDVTTEDSRLAGPQLSRRGGQAVPLTVWRQSGTPGVLVPQNFKNPAPPRPKIPANLGLRPVRLPLSAGNPPRPVGRSWRQGANRRRSQPGPLRRGPPPRGRRPGARRHQRGPRGPTGLQSSPPGPGSAHTGPQGLQTDSLGTQTGPWGSQPGRRRRQQPRRSPEAGEDIPPLPNPPPPTPSGQLAPPEPPSLPGPDEFPPLQPGLRNGRRTEGGPGGTQRTERGPGGARRTEREEDKITVLYGSDLKEDTDQVGQYVANWSLI